MMGQTLGPYLLEDRIGRGGMGQVYRASQRGLGRTVAVKTLLPALAEDEEFVERFLREARATARLRHPGIVTIYDVGEQDGVYYFAMEYLDGRTLDDVIAAEGPLEVARAVGLGGQIAHALAHAHAMGILHRDVKPANIIVETGGRAVLTDFGIARAASETRITQTGTTIGSPDYMSPEQVIGKNVDHRSDLYSLGIIFYQMFTGGVPYRGDSAVSVAFQHVNEPVRSIREANPVVPARIDAIAQRLMAKDPADRYESAGDLLAALEGEVPGTAGSGAAPAIVSATGNRGIKAVLGALAVVAAALIVIAAVYWQSTSGRSASGGRGGGGPPAVAASPNGEDGPTDGAPEGGNGAVSETVAPETAAIGPAADAVSEGASDDGAEVSEEVAAGPDSPDRADTLLPAGAPDGQSSDPPEVAAPAESVEIAPNVTGDAADAAEAAPVVETFMITSRPPGARVTLDGRTLDQVTPARVDLSGETAHELSLELPGHESTGFSFRLDDLTVAQRASGELFFPLESAIPPGTLVLQADYPVRLRIDGRSYEAERGTSIDLVPGDHEVEINAPDVFYSETRSVVIVSSTAVPLVLPPPTTITVGATPGYCRVSIDGVDIGYVPVTLEVVVGTHEFRFDWERLGQSTEVTRNIRLDTGRVFVAAPDGAAEHSAVGRGPTATVVR